MSTITPTRVDLFKAQNLKSTSEQLFGIMDPVPYQCSNIDKVIKSIRLCDKLSSKIDRMDEDDLRSALNDIASELWGLESDIEDIRKECENIREWGEAWKEQCKELVNRSDIDLNEFL